MNIINIDFGKDLGKVKPMHAVNNGPVVSKGVTGSSDAAGEGAKNVFSNLDLFREAHIPFVRNHDASFCNSYGGEYSVDVHRIFTDFDADPYCEENYDFRMTDKYLKDIELSGAKCFYRLGSRIEHEIKKVGTLPPKDPKKWAIICEHIIRHYNEGWANGFHMNLEYWEIWNEADTRDADGSNPCWQGTDEEFIHLFTTTLNHLKLCFPKLKIGGPAFCGPNCSPYSRTLYKLLFDEMKKQKLPLDFFSFHWYGVNPKDFANHSKTVRELLDSHGYTNTEIILNEWNYVRGWDNDNWYYTVQAELGLKGASFIAASMCSAHNSPMSMFMYYDARPGTGMNGMFNPIFYTARKGYYPFKMFGDMYLMDNAVYSESTSDSIYAFSAQSKDSAGIMLTHFEDDDNAAAKDIEISCKNLTLSNEKIKADFYLLDEKNDMILTKTEYISHNDFSFYLNVPLFSTYYIKLTVLE